MIYVLYFFVIIKIVVIWMLYFKGLGVVMEYFCVVLFEWVFSKFFVFISDFISNEMNCIWSMDF